MPAKPRARQLAILLAAVMLLAATPAATGAAGTQATGTRLARPGQERGVAITLLTGDKALLRQRPGGRQAVQVVCSTSLPSSGWATATPGPPACP
jgi:hypothetical protein